MGYEEEPKEPNHTSPKLLLFSQRFNKPELQGSCTPPPHTVATVPFQWEEAPGKPRSASTTTANDPPPQKSKSFRSLHLPPKMFTNYAKVGIINVLDGPYVGMHSSYSSPESVVSKSKWKMMMPFRKIMCKQASPVKLSSWSWDSFRDISSRGGGGGRGGRCSSSSCSSFDTFSNSLDSTTKTNKVSRGRNLMFFDKTTSSILESMYASINQAVPWRR